MESLRTTLTFDRSEYGVIPLETLIAEYKVGKLVFENDATC